MMKLKNRIKDWCWDTRLTLEIHDLNRRMRSGHNKSYERAEFVVTMIGLLLFFLIPLALFGFVYKWDISGIGEFGRRSHFHYIYVQAFAIWTGISVLNWIWLIPNTIKYLLKFVGYIFRYVINCITWPHGEEFDFLGIRQSIIDRRKKKSGEYIPFDFPASNDVYEYEDEIEILDEYEY